MKVLLTGNLGYIGSEMSKGLVREGNTVVGLDTNYFGSPIPFYPVNQIICDIRDVTLDMLEGVEAVIHLAALSNDRMGDINDLVTEEINLHATEKLAKLAKEAGVSRFLFASSCSVYGDGGGLEECFEYSPVNPLTTYARCKSDAENTIMELESPTFSPIILRNATVYGYSPALRNDLIVNTMTSSVFTTDEVIVEGTGDLWRPLIHVKDLVNIFLEVLVAPKKLVHNQIINVGFTNENYTVNQVADIVISKYFGAVVQHTSKKGDTRSYKVNFDKLKTMFPHISNKWSVGQGVEELLEYFRDYEAWVEHAFENGFLFSEKFVRLKSLSNSINNNKLDKNLRWK